jgi:hypothetical protein
VNVLAPPRPRTAEWEVGDTVNLGRVRWIIRTITGDGVELEASNTPTRIWWTTTLGMLPVKAVA